MMAKFDKPRQPVKVFSTSYSLNGGQGASGIQKTIPLRPNDDVRNC